MNKVTQKELKEYFSKVSDSLICSEKQKKVFISQLKNDVEAFLADNPDSTIKEVEDCFGTAEKIGKSFLENISTEKIKERLDVKKYILIALVAALVIYFAFVVISLIDVHTESHGYFEEGIMLIKNLMWEGVKV